MNFFSSRFETIRSYFQTQHFVWADLRNVFSWDYWSESPLLPETPYFFVSWAAIIVVIIALIFWRRRLKAAQTVAPIYDGSINQLANIISFIIIMAVSYSFFRAQAIAYLSSRLVVLASVAIVFGWLGWVIFYLTRRAPAKRRAYLERERYFRYIPKKKGKR